MTYAIRLRTFWDDAGKEIGKTKFHISELDSLEGRRKIIRRLSGERKPDMREWRISKSGINFLVSNSSTVLSPKFTCYELIALG